MTGRIFSMVPCVTGFRFWLLPFLIWLAKERVFGMERGDGVEN